MAHKLELYLAYGRTVNSTDVLRAAWARGIDFRIGGGGPYCSIRDLPTLKESYDHIVIKACNRERSIWFESCVYSHMLAGLTSYV